MSNGTIQCGMPCYPHRQSPRLKNYDYSQVGAYFLTVCVEGRRPVFGTVEDGRMVLTETGTMVEDIWANLPNYRAGIEMDVFVVMPNHVHGIVVVTGGQNVGGRTRTSAPTDSSAEPASSISEVVQRFKTFTTKQWQRSISRAPVAGERLWQRNFYEHVVRNESDLSTLREYTVNNPLKWALDRENPAPNNVHP